MNAGVKFLIRLQVQSENVRATARAAIASLDQLEAKARSVGQSLKRAFSLGNLAGQLTNIPGLALLTNPYALLGGGIAAVSKIGMQAEQTSIAFRTLVGDGDRASKMLSEIAEFADKTPFDRMGLTSAAQQMLSFGVSADRVTGYLRQLGDISGGDTGKLSSLALVMGQVTAAGKLSGQDNLQFINAGFNPLKELAQMTGQSYQTMQEAMSRGRISAEMVATAIHHATAEGGQFHGMMQALGTSGAGAFNQMMGAIQNGAAKVYEAVRPALLELFALVSDYAPRVFAALARGASVISGLISFVREWQKELLLAAWVIGSVTAVIKAQAIAQSILSGVTLVVKAATQGWTAVQWLLNVALTANPIGLVIVAVSALVGAVVYCWTKFAGFRAFLLTMWDVIKGFATLIRDYLIGRINELLASIGAVGKAIARLFSGDFSGAAEAAKAAGKGFLGMDSAAQARSSARTLLSGIGATYQRHLSTERAKDATGKATKAGKTSKQAGISTPSLFGSASGENSSLLGSSATGSAGAGRGGRGRTGDAIATGGTRSTQITMNIGKLIERIEVTMMDKTDTSELDRVVLSAVNRALAIATSTDR